MATRSTLQAIGKKKTDHGKMNFYAKGGVMKNDSKMEFKHATAMKKAGVPKKMVKEEFAEARGASKFAKGGGVESSGKTKGRFVTMKKGGKC